MEETLYEKLIRLGTSDEYPFHMPGHKRNMGISPFREMMELDITEIEGFDNLHHSEGIIREEQAFAAQLYGSLNTFYLVNGSTSGVLAAICSCTCDRDTVLMARNAHKSAYHAVYLKNLQVQYVLPRKPKGEGYPYGPVQVEDIEHLLEETQAKLVFLTSPSYEGIVSDIPKIAEVVHKRNALLLVDEAHGAHLGFHDSFPFSAVSQGADIVVQSLHKTLPSMTQTALLHVCSERVNIQRLQMNLGIFQTSSPSYVFMASMSRCLHDLSARKEEYFREFMEKLELFRKASKQWKHLKLLDRAWVRKQYDADMDPSKLVIYIENCIVDETGRPYRGKELGVELLEKYQLQMEMVSENYILAMTSFCDTAEGFDRLSRALSEIDQRLFRVTANIALKKQENQKLQEGTIYNEECEIVCSIKEAVDGERHMIRWENAVGETSGEFLYLYPPGYPILAPGEKITQAIWDKVQRYKMQKLNIQGPADYTLHTIAVL